MHQLEVDAVERQLGLVEVEEMADAVEHQAEEVALRVTRAGVPSGISRRARGEDGRAGQHREDGQARAEERDREDQGQREEQHRSHSRQETSMLSSRSHDVVTSARRGQPGTPG